MMFSHAYQPPIYYCLLFNLNFISSSSCPVTDCPLPIFLPYGTYNWFHAKGNISYHISGCFFTTSGGLSSFEHPLNELKPVPRVDSSGQMCGATFKVDAEAKKETTGMPRVGSAANWSNNV